MSKLVSNIMLIIIHACVTNTFDILDIINCVYKDSNSLVCIHYLYVFIVRLIIMQIWRTLQTFFLFNALRGLKWSFSVAVQRPQLKFLQF